jgi:tetratricopeptide (TPR) repeat protein
MAQPAAELDAVAPLYEMCNRCYPLAQARTDLHILQMLLHYYSGDTSRAMEHLESLGKLDMNMQGPGRFHLTDAMIADGRFAEAIELADHAVALAPTDVHGRSLLAGSLLHERQLDAAEPHIKILLQERDLDWYALLNICRPAEWLYRQPEERNAFASELIARITAWARDVGWGQSARYNLFRMIDWWRVPDVGLDLVRQLLDEGPRSSWIEAMHGYCVNMNDTDLAGQVLSVGQGLHLNPVSLAQLQAIQHAARGEAGQAIARAFDSRHGHGSRFSEMCQYLYSMDSDLGDLCDTLFDCVLRYHRGHGECSAWALLLLLANDRMDLFNTGLDSIASFQTDYTLEYVDRSAIQCSVTALQYMLARKNNDTEEIDRLRTVIAETRWFHVAVGTCFYDILDL